MIQLVIFDMNGVLIDSAIGVHTANAAGMFCVGYRNPDSGNQDLSTADLVIDRFDDPQLFHLFS